MHYLIGFWGHLINLLNTYIHLYYVIVWICIAIAYEK